ncbi:hemolysin III family protein [Rhodotorula paludigena]|uniref:hemolysin III family protein n=1 Tax=Rhodotorula paludigena TaxID=86838 RepID=UPI0031787BA1
MKFAGEVGLVYSSLFVDAMKGLLRYDQLEAWQRDNPLITSGYRPLFRSYLGCVRSIAGWHNESVNIWTHLFGATITVLTVFYLLLDLSPAGSLTHGRQGWRAPIAGIPYPFPNDAQPSVTWADTVGFASFLLSASVCLGFSAFFHTFLAHSQEVAVAWNRLDYVGIVVLISGTFVPLVHYGFFCDPHLRNTYVALIYTFAAATMAVIVSPKARTPEFRRIRTWLFIALGLSAVFPVGHAVLRYGLEGASVAISLAWLALGGALYIVGALLYAERVPERFSPGSFDLLLSSHQIFHVLILLAAWAHWSAITEGFRYWHGERGGTCPAFVVTT